MSSLKHHFQAFLGQNWKRKEIGTVEVPLRNRIIMYLGDRPRERSEIMEDFMAQGVQFETIKRAIQRMVNDGDLEPVLGGSHLLRAKTPIPLWSRAAFFRIGLIAAPVGGTIYAFLTADTPLFLFGSVVSVVIMAFLALN